ncbi:MAG: arginase family protein [Myxococcales bacterium]|nr:arginase family protein [Myxococcales bacterium]
MLTPLEVLTRALRPAGGGVYVVSTGVAEQQALQRRIYGAPTAEAIDDRWRAALSRLPAARAVLLGVPSDCGAGFTRGANRAPAALRGHLLDARSHAMWAEDVVDAGDVRVVPHLLSEEMLSAEQIIASRHALFGDDPRAAHLPVSPLGLTSAALEALFALAPDAVPVLIGGDHSVAWPAFAAAHAHWEKHRGRRLGLLHFDAHTDLLAERLGVKYCFATWAWHANVLLGADGRLVQVGVRASGHPAAHWEKLCNLRQIRAPEALARGAAALADEIIERFTRLGVDALYVSNDIDGTDPAFAAATGTPEPGGLDPDLVSDLTRRVAARFPLVGGDLVEVAPPLAHEVPGEPAMTLDTSARYLGDLLALAGAAR